MARFPKKYGHTQFQTTHFFTKRMGHYCKYCSEPLELSVIAKRLGTRPPWYADARFKRAYASRVEEHVRTRHPEALVAVFGKEG